MLIIASFPPKQQFANNNTANNNNGPLDWSTVQTQESFLQLLSADFEGNVVTPILAGMEELAESTCVQYAEQNATVPFDEFQVGDRKMTYYLEQSYRLQLLELLMNISPPGILLAERITYFVAQLFSFEPYSFSS